MVFNRGKEPVKNYRVSFGHIEIGETARRYLNEALDRKWVSEGPNVAKLETEFARKFGYPYTVATSSGTDAGIVTMASLHDLGASRGDEVITPACAFVSTANCILAAGLVPRFVDVELGTLNIDPALIEAAITPKTRAIQVVHTMGRPCRMAEIMDIAARHKLRVIEDSCEAHGATLHGKVIGSFGDYGLFSFYAAHMVCSAEGGMISTGDAELAALCKSIRSHGRRGAQLHFTFDRIGFNSKMNDLEAAVGLEGLETFDSTFSVRRGYMAALNDRLKHLEDRLILYRDGPGEIICPHAFPLVFRDPDASSDDLSNYLEDKGIQCKTLFGSLPTQHGAFKFLGYRGGEFPVSERLGLTGLHFGVHQYLTNDDLDYVVETVNAFFRK
jgi:dTDP-4-amino-4,6-dideoxygalactose transaminase